MQSEIASLNEKDKKGRHHLSKIFKQRHVHQNK